MATSTLSLMTYDQSSMIWGPIENTKYFVRFYYICERSRSRRFISGTYGISVLLYPIHGFLGVKILSNNDRHHSEILDCEALQAYLYPSDEGIRVLLSLFLISTIMEIRNRKAFLLLHNVSCSNTQTIICTKNGRPWLYNIYPSLQHEK
jgi:hypothetical protein